MKKFKCSLLTGILLGIQLMTYSQVTIGLDEAPPRGAMLQIKDKPEIIDGSANASKGFLLPRVELTDLDKLVPMYGYTTQSDTPSALELDAHTGLLVYHVKSFSSTIENGLYVWNGKKWEILKNNTQEAEVYLPESITWPDAGMIGFIRYIYTYDTQNRITSVKLSSVNKADEPVGSEIITSIYTFEYTGDKLTKINFPYGTYDVLYHGEEPIPYEISSTTNRFIVEFEGNKLMTKKNYWDLTPDPDVNYYYIYDSQSNLITTTNNGNDSNYTYISEKEGIFKNCKTPAWVQIFVFAYTPAIITLADFVSPNLNESVYGGWAYDSKGLPYKQIQREGLSPLVWITYYTK